MSAEEALFQRFGKEFPMGTVLFREGDVGREMYVLQSGKISISKKVRDVEKVLAILGPGEFFGEMAIISNKPRNASATVEDDARVLVIDPRTFEAMIRGNSTRCSMRWARSRIDCRSCSPSIRVPTNASPTVG